MLPGAGRRVHVRPDAPDLGGDPGGVLPCLRTGKSRGKPAVLQAGLPGFFIQPAVRTIFKLVFCRDIKARAREARQKEQSGKKLMPENEADAVAAIFQRIDEIKEELREEIVESLLESREKN